MNLLPVLAIVALSALDAPKGAGPEVLSDHFFVTSAAAPQSEPVETTNVPYRPGSSCYHWAIAVEPEPRSLTVREVFDLPGPAERWNSAPSELTLVRPDDSGAITEIQESLEDGLITHGWCVAQGDPVGRYRIRVFVGDQLLREFGFNVVDESF